MIFKKSFFFILLRVLVIVSLATGMVYTYMQTDLSITPVMFGALLFIAIIELTWHLQKQERNWVSFLHSVEFSDFNRAYQKRTHSTEMEKAYNLITARMEALQTNREAEFLLLQTVLRHVSVAVVCYQEEGEVVFTNTTFNELLGIPALLHINRLAEKYPAIYQVLHHREKAPSGWIDHDKGQKLFVKTEAFKLKGEALILASLTDIRSSLDTKELESYQKLMRVMTHEIMNSTTPILSLIRVVNKKLVNEEALNSLNARDQKNVAFSLGAIEERTAGMLKFVEAYKRINRPIEAHLEAVESQALLESVASLMSPEEEVTFTLKDELKGSLGLDKNLMSQVLINLVKNALEAVKNTDKPKVSIRAYPRADRTIIEVTDNGPGVPEKSVQEIFVPFFTTKAEGSGIGLALSRKIVKAHRGVLEYNRKGDRSVFTIDLPKRD